MTLNLLQFVQLHQFVAELRAWSLSLPSGSCPFPFALCALLVRSAIRNSQFEIDGLPPAYCLLPTAYCCLPFALCLFNSQFEFRNPKSKRLPPAVCLLLSAFCLLPSTFPCPFPVICVSLTSGFSSRAPRPTARFQSLTCDRSLDL